MAYTLKIGTCSCENEVVDKSGSVTLGSDISAVMVNTDSLNPVFKVQGSYSGSNYCICSEFGRFYYIENVEALAGGHCLLHCHVDVLYTYASDIVGLSCLVLRNEDINKWKRDYTDLAIPVSNRRVTYGKNFGNDMVNGGTLQEFLIGVI